VGTAPHHPLLPDSANVLAVACADPVLFRYPRGRQRPPIHPALYHTKFLPQCLLIVVISVLPLNLHSPVLDDSGLQCRPYPLDDSTFPNSSPFCSGIESDLPAGLSVSYSFTYLAYLLFSQVSECPDPQGIGKPLTSASNVLDVEVNQTWK